MIKWEYQQVWYKSPFTVVDLNEEGEKGWEVVEVRNALTGKYANYILFKRRKE